MGYFINFSNHPSANWGENQLTAAMEYGEIIDVPFPLLDAEINEEEIKKIGEEYVSKILAFNPTTVMCQGEFTLTFYVVKRLIEKGIVCVSACTKRVSKETLRNDGIVYKKSVFTFVGFRKYI